jgi:uncharacterized delta-60 repeat protein
MKRNSLLSVLFIFSFTIINAQVPDPSFGANGIVQRDLGLPFNYSSIGRQVLTLADGSMYFVTENAGLTAVEKKQADGSPDVTYGNNGYSMPAPIYSAHAALQADGKIVIAGYTLNAHQYYDHETDFAVARYKTDGSFDSSFGVNGIQVSDFGHTSVATCLAIQSDGKIVVAGYVNSVPLGPVGLAAIEIARYNIDGSLDLSVSSNFYDGNPMYDPSQRAYSIAVQSDGKIVLGIIVSLAPAPRGALVRYKTGGSLDSTFNTTGLLPLNFDMPVNSVAIQSDGKILAGTSVDNGTNKDFAVERVNSDGTPDNTFDADAIQTVDFSGNNDTLNAITLQSDGQIILAGFTSDGTHSNFAVARLNTDGSPDNSFNSNGKQVTDFGSSSDDYINAITIQSDGKLVATGYTNDGVHTYLAASRYNANGTPDNSFDGDGLLTTHITQGNTRFTSTTLQADGKLLTAGYTWNGTNYDFVVTRNNTNGTPDNSFDGDGVAITDFGSTRDIARGLVVQGDGKILLAGSAGDSIGIVRYNADGTLDNTFNGSGKLITAVGSVDSASSIALEPDGKIVVGGNSLLRLNSNGTPDVTFNGTGIVTPSFGFNALVIQNDGKIIIAGGGVSGIIARYNSDGSTDNAFGNDGNGIQSFYSPDPYFLYLKSIKIQADGKIVAAGYQEYNYRGIRASFLLVRLNADGTHDPAFGNNGEVLTSIGGTYLDYGSSLVITSDNKIIVAGSSYNGSSDNFTMVQYNIDGTVDSSFGQNGALITKPTSTAAANSSFAVSAGYDAIAGMVLSEDRVYAAGYGQYPGSLGVVAKYILTSAGPLPVTLTDFTATLKNNIVALQWQTASEQNLSGFIIERSADGNNFSPIGNVTAKGNSNIKINYAALDQQPLQGINYYRIKIFDTNGKFVYSKIVFVNMKGLFTLRIFPNPAGNTLFVQANGENEKALFKITDITGHKLKEINVTLNETASIPIDISTLPKGIYNLVLLKNNKIQTLQFIKE